MKNTRGEGMKVYSRPERAFYTGITYIAVVIFLVLPFLLMEDVFSALLSMLSSASLMVILFSVYLAVIRERSIVRSALEMLSISLGVAALSYIIGIAARGILGLSID
jgi:VIT1/CCC1 family predicted Fe2+/Mn2+ transporter